MAESVEVLESWGLRVDVGRHVLDEWGYMAGRDEDRLADLNDAFRDPTVRAIIATRGGAGAYRIADGVDFDAVRADPKPLVGFSDTPTSRSPCGPIPVSRPSTVAWPDRTRRLE